MTLPNFSFERKLWKKGYKIVCGVDEVGRGSLAGPVFAGAVAFAPILNSQFLIIKGAAINDSKKLSPVQRENSASWIKENCLAWGIGSTGVKSINKLGIVKATEIAVRKALKAANLILKTKNLRQVEHLLSDAFYLPYTNGLSKKFQTPIIRGDSLSISIAAASIIAKVERDAYMENLAEKFQKYGWFKNKGYGTKDHQEAIIKHGTTPHHRNLFVKTFLKRVNL